METEPNLYSDAFINDKKWNNLERFIMKSNNFLNSRLKWDLTCYPDSLKELYDKIYELDNYSKYNSYTSILHNLSFVDLLDYGYADKEENEKTILLKDSSIDYFDFIIQKGRWWTNKNYFGLPRKDWDLAESLTAKDKVNIACVCYAHELYITEIEKDKDDRGNRDDFIVPDTPNGLIRKYGNPSLFMPKKKVLQEA